MRVGFLHSLFLASALAFCGSAAWANPLSCLEHGVSPTAGDLDGDGIPDELDRVPDDPASACLDFDGDGLNDLREFWFGTNPANPDTDRDRLTDGEEVLANLDPLNPDDALLDGDADGFPGWYEAFRGTDAASSSSAPPIPAPFTAGRYIRHLSDESPGWMQSFGEIYDFDSDGTFRYHGRNGAALTGTWTQSGAFVEITYDPGQELFRSYPYDGDFGGQVEQIRYVEAQLIGRSDELEGRSKWVVRTRYRDEVTQTGAVTIFETFDSGRPVVRADRLSTFGFQQNTNYVIPCYVGGPSEVLFSQACRIAVGPGGSVTNAETLAVGSLSQGPNGEAVIDFGSGTEIYSIYVVRDFGGYQRAAVLIERADGTSVLTEWVVVEDTGIGWPGDNVGIYQYPWQPGTQLSGSSAFVVKSDGLMELITYQSSSGTWTGGLWGGWQAASGTITAERYYVPSPFKFIRDPSQCATLNCRLQLRRIMEPVALVGDELLIMHTFELYDTSVSSGPDVLLRETRDLRSIVRTPFFDLSLNGIDDSIDPDIDGDGLPDAWERSYFPADDFSIRPLHKLEQTGDDDPDGDGLSNRDEYLNGWDPLMPNPNRPASLAGIGLAGSQSLAPLLRDEARGRNFAYSLDASSGIAGAPVAFGTEAVIDSGVVPDISGDGADELAVLLWDGGPVEVRSKTMSNGALVSRVFFDQTFQPRFLLVMEDALGGLGGAAIGVLGTDASGRNRAQVKNAQTGALVGFVWFDPGFEPIAAAVLPDMTGNNVEEIAVLGVDMEGRVRAQIKDVATGSLVSLVYFDRNFSPTLFGVMPDVDGDGAADLGVLGEDGDGIVRLQVKDAATGALSALVRYESGFTPHALFGADGVLGDSVAGVLARNTDGVMRLQVKSLSTGAPFSVVGFDGTLVPKGVTLIDDVSGNAVPEVAVLGLDRDDRAVVQVKDLRTGAFVQRSTVPE